MRRAQWLWITVAAWGLLLPRGAGAAGETTVQLTIEGVVVTENADPARLNQVPVVGFGQSVSVPYDPATGLATGARRFRPIVLGIISDKALPRLLEAASNGAQVDAVIRFYDGAGDPAPSFQISTTGGILLSISGGGHGDDRPTEEIAFSFGQVEWTHVASGETHVENWAAGP